MYAVTVEPLSAIFFMEERPEGIQWEIQEGVDLDNPPNLWLWPDGEPAPEGVLCRSTSDPKRYKVFKYRREIDPGEFQPTGKNFGGIYSKAAWERFQKFLLAELAIRAIPDDDPPGAMDEAIRSIREAR